MQIVRCFPYPTFLTDGIIARSKSLSYHPSACSKTLCIVFLLRKLDLGFAAKVHLYCQVFTDNTHSFLWEAWTVGFTLNK